MGWRGYNGEGLNRSRNGFRDRYGNAMNQFSNGTQSGRGLGTSNLEGNNFITHIFLKFNLDNRSSIIITASFSVAASTIVIFSIMYDSWQSSRRTYRPHMRRPFNILRHIPPANVLPLTLSIASIIQSSILIGIQSTGLEDLFADGCLASSQITWTAVWIVGYVVLTFTSNAVYRSFMTSRLATNGRWNSLICWAIVTILLLLTWIPSKIREGKKDRCLATLLQWAVRWSDIALGLTISLIGFFVTNGVILSIRLRRFAKIDSQDRIILSSMVYYLAGTTIIFALALPFWVQGTFSRSPTNSLLLMGSIGLNLFGIVYAFIYLLLRANGGNLLIGPEASTWPKERLNGPDSGELALSTHNTQPIISKEHGIPYFEKEDHLPVDDNDLDEERLVIMRSSKPAPSSQISTPRPLVIHTRKPSGYSLFPARDSSHNTRRFILNFNDSCDDMLAPPRPSYARHRRFSSEISAATVQIGLRLSNIAISTHLQNHNSSTMSLGLSPIQTEAPLYSASAQNQAPTVARSQVSQQELKPSARLLTVPPVNQNVHDTSKISPLRQNPPESEISQPRFHRWSPLAKLRENSSHKKNSLPPTPLLAPKVNTHIPSEPSPLAQSASRSPSQLPPSWPLPDRFSILPNKTFKPPAHWI
ncbi:hypothetical protein AJ78_06228 [Emergomyces pasteurianus Ep9510]|uniref:Uncharacterized protein n=1 Tax=Emergomyces pasteurianus Ep9510 TaxID=1447872 RepID=A0A1J9P9Y0_9EURO|nr:hypothetical protein AJ78_06228 [Emergomyces pasteurianus Ep9510]